MECAGGGIHGEGGGEVGSGLDERQLSWHWPSWALIQLRHRAKHELVEQRDGKSHVAVRRTNNLLDIGISQ